MKFQELNQTMKLQELIHEYCLHDSGIDGVHYFAEQNKLILDVTLGLWCQEFSLEGDPEYLMGQLIFTGVSWYKLDAETLVFDYDEILTARVKPAESTEDPKKERLELVLLAMHFPERKQEIKLLSLEAEQVECQWEKATFTLD